MQDRDLVGYGATPPRVRWPNDARVAISLVVNYEEGTENLLQDVDLPVRAFYDLERFGLRFVASPRHADVLLVTGPVTKNMREALERTWAATPDPKWVVAVGKCAIDGGVFAGSYAVSGGVSAVVPVDLHIRGCPPRPVELLSGLLALLERM